jgi:hypothetical protein
MHCQWQDHKKYEPGSEVESARKHPPRQLMLKSEKYFMKLVSHKYDDVDTTVFAGWESVAGAGL